LQNILDACPGLEHLVIDEHKDLPCTHPNIKWVDVWSLIKRYKWSSKPPWCKTVLDAWKDWKAVLPSLQNVRILREGLPSPLEIPFLVPPHETTSNTDLEIQYSGIRMSFKHGCLFNSTPDGKESGYANGSKFFDWTEIDCESTHSETSGHSSEQSDWDTAADENSGVESDGDFDIYVPVLLPTEDSDSD
jgi:hypothetical protein